MLRVHGLQIRFKFDDEELRPMVGTVAALDLPFDEAIRFLREKASVPTRSWRDVWDGAHSKMFMVAGANTVAIVDDFKAAIAKALEQGTTLEDFRTDFDQIVKRHGWSHKGERGWRTKTIFETNLRTAYAAGRYAQLTDPDTLSAFPGWQYNHSGALHPRVDHLRWNGQVFAATDPVWDAIFPPSGFGCGCFVTPVSMPALRRMGKAGFDRAPNLDQLGTDQPRGVDPSFAYNPGKAWLRHAAPGPQAVSAREAQVAAFVRSSLAGKWPPQAYTPVATASEAVAAQLDVAIGTEIRLSASTIRSHLHHDRISPDAYGVLPRWLVRNGILAQDKSARFAFVGEYEGKLYHAAIKRVDRGEWQEIWLTSLRRTERRDILRRFNIDWDRRG